MPRQISQQQPVPSLKVQDSSDDSFPLDEMDPDALGKHAGVTTNSTMIRTSLPMRTLFGSQSSESLNLGTGNAKSDLAFPEPVHLSNTDVVKTSFDSWSDFDVQDPSIDSFSNRETRNTQPGSGSVNNMQASNTNLTGSALKRLREKRQKHFSSKVSPSYHQDAWEEPSTPKNAAETSVSIPSSRTRGRNRSYYSPASPDPSSTVSPSLCSETSFSTSHVQSTNGSGYTNESDLQKEGKLPPLKSTLHDVVPDADQMIPDEFVSEKNASVQSFQSAYESMSLEQIANDMKEEATSALSMNFLNQEFLNKGMYAAGESLNKLVAGMTSEKRQQQHRLIKRAVSPVEEVAIEVEFIADSEDDP
ncbi:MAG: hypothetical protein SGILL_005340 [Bacillariaceae sp.]